MRVARSSRAACRRSLRPRPSCRSPPFTAFGHARETCRPPIMSLAIREQPPQRSDQPLEFDRLGVELVAPGGKRLFARAGERVGGERDDRDVARFWIGL